MNDLIPLARPALGDAEIAAAERVIRSGQLTGGDEIVRFEERLATICNRTDAVAVSSGTTALELSLWALDIGPGDQILVTGYGFPAAANAGLRQGATVVPVDVDVDTWCVDWDHANEQATRSQPRPKLLISIDAFGAVTDAAAIRSFTKAAGIPVVSDAACGLGGLDRDGSPAGAAGIVATLSFHPRKLVTTGEGGAIATDDRDLARRLRGLRNHGQQKARVFTEPGSNARLSAVAAALGSAQLERMDSLVRERELLGGGYRERLAKLERLGKLQWQKLPPTARHAHQTFAVVLADRYSRERVISGLAERGIESGMATYSLGETGIHPRGHTPVADRLHRQALALPMYNGMRSAQLDRVVDGLEQLLS